MSDSNKSWEKFLNPESLKENLITISLFISIYEMFKSCIIDKPKTFFSDGFDKNGFIINEKYKTDVLSKSKSSLLASLLWFKELGAIDDEDIETYQGIRKHRNEVTHEIIGYISDTNTNFDVQKFQDLINLLDKIEKWWLINFEIAIDPDMVPEGANIDEVIPGPIWSIRLMLDIAFNNEPEEGYYYNAFVKKSNEKNT